MLLPGVPDNVVLIARAQDSGPLKSRCPPLFSLSSCSLVRLLDVECESAYLRNGRLRCLEKICVLFKHV